MEKSPEAFRTISEVAEDLDLPQHVLRFWETRFSQIKPLKRGGGRRYYRPDDVHLLRGIKHLLYGEGYTIKGVQRILREQGVRHVMGLWRDEVSEPAPRRPQSPEAFAPKPGRPAPAALYEPGDDSPDAYGRSSARKVTARRPNFEPIVHEDEEEEDVEEEELEEEDEAAEDEEAADAEAGEGEDEEPEDDEEADEDDDAEEDSDDEAEDSDEEEEEEGDEEADDEEDEDDADEEDDDDEAEADADVLTDESRRKLEQALRELTELRRAIENLR